jgi:hypothetical protein
MPDKTYLVRHRIVVEVDEPVTVPAGPPTPLGLQLEAETALANSKEPVLTAEGGTVISQERLIISRNEPA